MIFEISLQPNKEQIKGKFINNVLKSSLPGALAVLFFHLIIYFIGAGKLEIFNFISGIWLNEEGNILLYSPSNDIYITITLIITTGIALAVLYRTCKPFDPLRGIVFGVSAIATFTFVALGLHGNEFVNGFLNLTHLDASMLLFTITCLLLINWMLALADKLLDLMGKIKISE